MKIAQRWRIPWQKQLAGQTVDLLFVGAGLGLGALAFLWAGYLGNPDPTLPWYNREPWTLFGYFCVVILALEALVLTSAKRPSRAKVITILGVTVVWIILAVVVYFRRADIVPAIKQWLQVFEQQPRLLLVLADLVSIVLLWLGIRFASYDPHPHTHEDRKPIPAERFAGDLLLSTLFSVLLAWVFFWPLWQGVANLLTRTGTLTVSGTTKPAAASPMLNTCDWLWLPPEISHGKIVCPTSPFDITTIFMLDLLILPFIYLLIALVILLIGAGAQALDAFRTQGDPLVLVSAIRRVLLDIVERRIKNLPYLLLALRYFWPVLLLVAVVLTGLASKEILIFLYGVAVASNGQVFWLMFPEILHGNLLLFAIEIGAAATVFLALALGVIAATAWAIQTPGKGRSARQEMRDSIAESWRHVRFIGLAMVVSFWALSAVFSIINQLALIGVTIYERVTQTPHSQLTGWYWAPFVQPDLLTLLSLAAFLASMFVLRARRADDEAAPAANAGDSAAVLTPTPASTPPRHLAQE